jgi:hypothetical protein
MYNDSVETLLLRHHGSNAPIPSGLEQRLLASTRRDAAAIHQQALAARRVQANRLSRRRAVKLVALGSAGLSMLSVGLEVMDTSLLGTRRQAFS